MRNHLRFQRCQLVYKMKVSASYVINVLRLHTRHNLRAKCGNHGDQKVKYLIITYLGKFCVITWISLTYTRRKMSNKIQQKYHKTKRWANKISN